MSEKSCFAAPSLALEKPPSMAAIRMGRRGHGDGLAYLRVTAADELKAASKHPRLHSGKSEPRRAQQRGVRRRILHYYFVFRYRAQLSALRDVLRQ